METHLYRESDSPSNIAALLLRILPERERMRENERESLIPEERDESEEASQRLIGLHVAKGHRIVALASIRSLIGNPGIGDRAESTPITMALAELYLRYTPSVTRLGTSNPMKSSSRISGSRSFSRILSRSGSILKRRAAILERLPDARSHIPIVYMREGQENGSSS
jgi:hypothetical protein